jgi:hypothetical protein
MVRRSAVLPAVKQHAEAALAYVSWLYGGHTRLWLQGAPASACPIMSQSGVRQGEPLAPALFALTALGPMQRTQQAVPGARIVGIDDDMAIQGTPGIPARAYRRLCQEMARVGPQPQPTKCVAYSEDQTAGQAEADNAACHSRPTASCSQARWWARHSCCGNGRMIHASTFVIVRARSRTFTPGSPVPVADAGYV